MKIIYLLFFYSFLIFSCQNNIENNSEEKNSNESESEKADSSNVEVNTKDSIRKQKDTLLVLSNNGNGKYGYKDSLGNWFLKPEFDLAGEFSNRLAPVLSNGKWHLMNKSGKFVYDFEKFKPIVIHYELSGEDHVAPITEKTIAIEFENGKQGFLKLFNGKVTAEFDEVQPFYNGRAAVRKGEKWGYITLNGKFLIKPILEGAYSFSNKRGIINKNGLYGIINVKGKVIVKPSFRGAFRYKEDLTFVTFSNEYTNYFLIGLNGEVINKGPYEQVFGLGFENGECEVMMNGKCIVIDKKGNKIREKKDGCQEGC